MVRLADQIESYEGSLINSLKKVEENFIERLLNYIRNNYVKAGILQMLSGREFSRAVINVANSSKRLLMNNGYENVADDFLGRFDDIERQSIQTLIKNIGLKKGVIEHIVKGSTSRKFFYEQTKQSILKTGIGSEYLEGVKNMIATNLTQGTSFSDLEKQLHSFYTEREVLTQRVRQIATDSMSHYNGHINEAVATELKVEHFKYKGGLITTTRPFCEHITSLQKGFEDKILTNKDFQGALDEFCPNGTPSKSVTKNILGKKTTKGAGMVVGTTIANFGILRGGYNCRHEKIPVAVTNDEKDRIKARNS